MITEDDMHAEYLRGREDGMENALYRRGIGRRGGDPCGKCSGLGARMYSHGSTWRGGMGTVGGRHDICDDCWGSGDDHEPWLNLRTLEETNRRLVAERAVDALARSCGASLVTAQDSVIEIIAALDKIARGRRVSLWTSSIACSLANILRRAIGVAEVRL